MTRTLNITISDEAQTLVETIMSKIVDNDTDDTASVDDFVKLAKPDISADERDMSNGADSVFELVKESTFKVLTLAYCWDSSQLYGWDDTPVNVVAKLSEVNGRLSNYDA